MKHMQHILSGYVPAFLFFKSSNIFFYPSGDLPRPLTVGLYSDVLLYLIHTLHVL